MLFWPTTVRDDRGKRIKLTLARLDAESRLKDHHKRLNKQLAERHRVRREAAGKDEPKPPAWWRRLYQWPVMAVFGVGAMTGALGFVAGLVLAASAPLIATAVLLGYSWQAGVVATFALAIGIAIVWGWRHRDQSRYHRAKSLARIRVCGMCGYSLEDLELAADGKVECPECGAGWDVTDQSTAICPSCDESIEMLTVTAAGVAECPGCREKFSFAPSGPDANESAIDGF